MIKNLLILGTVICCLHNLQAGIKRVFNNTNIVYTFTLTDSTGKKYSVLLHPGAMEDIVFSGHSVKKIMFAPKVPVHKPFTDLYKRGINEPDALNENMIYVINPGQVVTMYEATTDHDYTLLQEYDSEYQSTDGSDNAAQPNNDLAVRIQSILSNLK